ncbi:N,N'-diacetylchitobiose transport system permease protein [Actinacidiphila paucisporea]|uniref:N,N'-diacetylchitobiose transport system permease protein n=1 Tax=Actinacidiphila paucisporea TaxID=310782 RepID=A0A1M7K9J4_9ACTN|nr:N,N'-diacetylchitobiose transport system permease protein [Actinacidiphila paucisporea]
MLTARSAAPRPAVVEPPPAVPRPRRRRLGAVWPYLLIAPTVLGAAFLLVYPLVRNTVMSFQHFGLGELIRGGATWVGFANYRTVLDDPEFWTVVRRTLWWTGLNVVLIMVLGTLVALMLNRLGRRMRLAVMSGLVLTWATPVIAATTIFQWLFQSRFGVVNWTLVKLGFDSYRDYTWFAHGGSTFAILVVLVVWQSVPFAALTLYGGLTTIPVELYESARIDGAGAWQSFRLVTFPMLRPLFALVTSLEVIWCFKAFTQIWVISEGGPNGATTTLPVYAFQIAQSLHKYDLGAAVSTLTVLILLAALVFNLRRMFRQEGAL